MIYLIDTNVLLRVLHSTDPISPIAQSAVRSNITASGNRLQSTSQNFMEFWNVSTRPIQQNGMGLIPSEAIRPLRRAEQLFPCFLIFQLFMLYGENLLRNTKFLVYKFTMRGLLPR